MATWNSKHQVTWPMDTGFEYITCENTWSYHTVSDFLTVRCDIPESSNYSDKKFPQETRTFSYSQYEALALLETLLDWAYTYEGPEEVDKILNKIKKT